MQYGKITAYITEEAKKLQEEHSIDWIKHIRHIVYQKVKTDFRFNRKSAIYFIDIICVI